MFYVTDSYGTSRLAWTRRTALEWLAACSPDAKVTNLWGRVVAARSQTRVY